MEKLGIPVDYSYPITGIIGEEIILKNEWGALRWSEFYGTTEIRLPLSEFKAYFDSVVVSKVIEDGCHNSVSLRQKKGFYSLLRLTVEEDCTAFITLSQIHTLNLKEEYSGCRIALFEACHSSVVYLQEEESGDKKTTMEVELLRESEYLVLVVMDWADKEHETVLSVLSGHPVDLAKLKYNTDNDYLLTLKKQKTQSEKMRGKEPQEGGRISKS